MRRAVRGKLSRGGRGSVAPLPVASPTSMSMTTKFRRCDTVCHDDTAPIVSHHKKLMGSTSMVTLVLPVGRGATARQARR